MAVLIHPLFGHQVELYIVVSDFAAQVTASANSRRMVDGMMKDLAALAMLLAGGIESVTDILRCRESIKTKCRASICLSGEL